MTKDEFLKQLAELASKFEAANNNDPIGLSVEIGRSPDIKYYEWNGERMREFE